MWKLLQGALPLTLLTLPLFSQTQETVPTPTKKVSASKTSRTDVGHGLRHALQTAPQEGALAHLLKALDRATAELPIGYQNKQLQDLKQDVRWMAVFDAEEALAHLQHGLREHSQNLAFEPLMESPLPEGFPAPVPVGEIQIKSYPAYRMGQTDASKLRANGAFWTLFKHIQSNDIAMTAPVEMTFEPNGEKVRETKMAFLYRTTRQGQLGEQGRVVVTDVPAMQTLTMGCRGDTNYRNVARLRKDLEAWLDKQPEWQVAGELRVMGYNSPMVPWNKRYFEIEIPIERKPLSSAAQTGAPNANLRDV